MVEIYGSWMRGLAQNKEALAIIKSSGKLAGIELSSFGEDVELIKQAGLKYSLHNPLRDYKVGLESKYFIPMITKLDLKKTCNESSPPAIGFHTGYASMGEKNSDQEDIVFNTLKSIRFLDDWLDKKIIFESTGYHKHFFSTGDRKTMEYVTSPEFFKRLISKSKAGFLFDVSHNFVSGTTKILEGEYKGEISDYFSDVLNVVSKDTYEMHLNIPGGNPKAGYFDVHYPIKMNQKTSKEILLLAKEVLDCCPNLKTITLEIDSGKNSPKQHAKMLVGQAELLKKNLL